MDQRQSLTVEEGSPLWVHRAAHFAESAANSNGLRVSFRQVQTPEGPVVAILLAPAKPIDCPSPSNPNP
jgi:hypothetical protein